MSAILPWTKGRSATMVVSHGTQTERACGSFLPTFGMMKMRVSRIMWPKLRMLKALFWCCAPLLLSSPALSQTFELSTRTFWIGEPVHPMDESQPFLGLKRINWLKTALDKDPALKDAVVHFELSFRPVDDILAHLRKDRILLGADRLPESYLLDDYHVFGPEVSTASSFMYIPRDPEARFNVRCGQTIDRSRMSLCVVIASYAPDDFVLLQARLYFPPDPADRPNYFRDVVQRMREIAYCLDITDQPMAKPDRNLQDCNAHGSS